MSEWQVIISDLSQQITVMFSPKTLKQNNKKDKWKSYEKKSAPQTWTKATFKPKGLTKCQWEVALKALSKQ